MVPLYLPMYLDHIPELYIYMYLLGELNGTMIPTYLDHIPELCIYMYIYISSRRVEWNYDTYLPGPYT